MVRDNIPADAITILYQSGRKTGEYSFWKRTARNADGDIETKWYWSALGNSGIEEDVDDAKQAAIRFIRDHR